MVAQRQPVASKEAPADHHWSYLVLRRWAGWTKRYLGRIAVWAGLLRTVRGVSLRDSLVMCLSACAAPVFAFRKLDKWQNPILLADCKVEVAGVGRFHLSAGTDELYLVYPRRESAILEFVAQTLTAGDTFVDVGANIGFHSMHAAHLVGPEGQVHSFEMMPPTQKKLAENLRLNQLASRVEMHSSPLAHVAGLQVEGRMSTANPGQASYVRTAAEDAQEIVFAMQTSTLDHELADVRSIKIMKVDVEGAEKAVFQGAAQTLAKCSVVVYESLAKFAESNAAVERLLQQAGFQTRPLDHSNRIAFRQDSTS